MFYTKEMHVCYMYLSEDVEKKFFVLYLCNTEERRLWLYYMYDPLRRE